MSGSTKCQIERGKEGGGDRADEEMIEGRVRRNLCGIQGGRGIEEGNEQ